MDKGRDIFKYYNAFDLYGHVNSILRYGDLSKLQNPIISIMMPVYSHPDYFRQSLQSVLNQNFDYEYEIVVVDNNPYDESIEPDNLKVVKSFNADNIFYYQNCENIGLFGNWNRCIQLSRAEWITYCHDDDLFLSDALSKLYNASECKNAVFSAYNKIDENGCFIDKVKYPKTYFGIICEKESYKLSMYDLFFGSIGFGVGCLFSRIAMLELGGFNADFYPCSDYIMFTRYVYHYGAVFLNAPVFNYRIAQNVSLSIYEQFAPGERVVAGAIINKMNYPKLIFNLVAHSKQKVSEENNQIIFGGIEKQFVKKAGLINKLIYYSFRLPCKLKKYVISFI